MEHGSLYPALQRLEAQRLVRAEWGVSENQRRARYYELTARGRKHLTAEASRWRAMTAAIGRVLRSCPLGWMNPRGSAGDRTRTLPKRSRRTSSSRPID